MDDKRSNERGFTLVELLVSLLILSLIFTLMAAAISQASTVAKRTGTDTGDQRKQRVTDTIARLISSIEPRFEWNEDQERSLAFEGLWDSVRFIGDSPSPAMTPGSYSISITQNSRGALFLSFEPFKHGASNGATENTRGEYHLFEEKAVIEFQYGAIEQRGQTRWYEEWPFENLLPQYVRFRLSKTTDLALDANWQIARVQRARHDLRLNLEDEFQ